MIIHKKVEFKNEIYWLHSSSLDEEWYNISPLDHYSENGELLANPFSDISFAIMSPEGQILRYGAIIGSKLDLKEVE
jgi:hypothetical protein